MRTAKISDAVVRRLPLYLRILDQLAVHEGPDASLSSQELGERAGVSPALVRKDLAWFGEFGKQGVGYDVQYLRTALRKILHLDKEIRIALAGVGNLGLALARYHRRRYLSEPEFHLHIVALFDNDPAKWGEEIDGVPITPMSQMPEMVRRLGIRMGIITVPAEAAQEVANQMVRSGVRLILNFAPATLSLPEHVHVATADLSVELQRLSYYLDEDEASPVPH
ncbi:MAG: redox-sensing transcriptional repressor Rex [Limnochordaceae bacterium]|nr:redox-sensing transcriptional repressor Rex [Limnochordaceae bacterium]